MFRLLFGKNCLICRFESDQINIICDSCEKKVDENLFKKKLGRTFVLFKYKGVVRSLILNGKYRFNMNVWRYWFKYFKDLDMKEDNLLVYVPTTFKRFCFRGFNQSYLIAKGLEKCGYGEVCSILRRTKFNKSTSLLGKEDRVSSIRGNFEIKPGFENYLNKIVLIVDDVLTTGATMNEIENVLIKNGFKKNRIRKFALASGRLNAD